MKKIVALLLILAAFAVSAEAQVRSTNVVYKFTTSLTGSVDTVQVTNSGSASMFVKSWAGAADGVSWQVNAKKVSGTTSGFKVYLYPSNDGVVYGSTPIDSVLITNTAGTIGYVKQGTGSSKFNAPFYRALFQGSGTGVVVFTSTIIGKK